MLTWVELVGSISERRQGIKWHANSARQLLQSLSIPGDNDPTRETLSMMKVEKDREARRSIRYMFTSAPSPTARLCVLDMDKDTKKKATVLDMSKHALMFQRSHYSLGPGAVLTAV